MKTYVLIMILVAFNRSGPGYAGGPRHRAYGYTNISQVNMIALRH